MLPRSKSLLPAVVAGLLVSLNACQTWKVQHRPVEAVVQEQQGGKVALTMNDRRWVVLSNPRVERDSVVGIRTGGNTYGKGRTAVPVAGVRAVETRGFSILRTLYLGVAAAFVPSLYRLAVVDNE
jgi:hypothetical protein